MISREFVEAHRRRVFAAAAVELVDEFGIRELTVTMLCDLAHSSRGKFYELFANSETCLRHAQAEGFELLFGETVGALGAEGEWGHRVEAARHGLFAGAQADPELARFTLIHARALPSVPDVPDAGTGISALATLLARQAPAGFREEFVACIHVGLLAQRLLVGEVDSLHGLADELDWTLDLLPATGRRSLP
jgi:AcrR family transcriptional regulator